MLDLMQDAATPFVSGESHIFPVWAPDSKQLAFRSSRNSETNMFLKPLAGNAPEERLLDSPYTSSLPSPTSWTQDGKFLIFTMLTPQMGSDIWLLPLSGERKPQPLIQRKGNDRAGVVSPDGHWLAYASDEPGNFEVYVTQFPQTARSWKISRSGGVRAQLNGDPLPVREALDYAQQIMRGLAAAHEKGIVCAGHEHRSH
jgi:eukaryotic-like serine/threonine-protein kinase